MGRGLKTQSKRGIRRPGNGTNCNEGGYGNRDKIARTNLDLHVVSIALFVDVSARHQEVGLGAGVMSTVRLRIVGD